MSATERSFYAGLWIVCVDMAIYGFRGLPSGTADVLFHAMAFTLGGLLMVPKLFPGIFSMAMATVQVVLGKFRSTP